MLYGHTEWVWDVSILNTGQHLLSVSSDGSLKLWNVVTGVKIKEFLNKDLKNGEF